MLLLSLQKITEDKKQLQQLLISKHLIKQVNFYGKTAFD
jgi:hypothetical protein